MKSSNLLQNNQFPLSSKYDLKWLIKNCYAANPLWLAEWFCRNIEFEKGMRILDLGCGGAKSSIFLAREFDTQVWAVDLWNDPTENYESVCKFGLQKQVFPIKSEADKLPFPFEFFDAILSFDAIQYFGTDMLFLPYIVQF